MESPSSTSTTTSTTAKHDNIPLSQNPTVDDKKSNTDPTLPIPNPAHSPVFQKYVTDAKIIASTRLTRNMFIVEVFKKCSEIALWEKRTGKTSPELLPTSPVPTRELLPLHTPDSYSSDVQHITPEGDDVLNRFIKKYSVPKLSNPVSGSTSTVTASSAAEHMSPETSTSGLTNTVTSNLGESTPTTITPNPTEGSTPYAKWRKTTRMATENSNTSGSMKRNRVEQGLPNQALTLFAPVGMAEDLTKVQLILCNEIKMELKAVKESIAAIPVDDVQRKVTEASTMLEEKMSNLEDQYNELKELIIHKTTQNLITDPTLLDH